MSFDKSFLSHFIVIGSGTIVNMLLGLLTTPIITRIVNPNEYGQLSIFNMYTNIAVMVLCIGLDQALVRFFYEKKETGYKRGLFKVCFWMPFFISMFCVSFLIILAYMGVITLEFSTNIICLLGLNIIFHIWNRFSILLLRITYQSKKYSMCNVLQKFVYVGLALFLVNMVKADYLFLLILSTISSVFISSVFAVFSTRDLWKFWDSEKLLNKKQIIGFGIPFIFSMGLTTLFQAIDKISLNHYCSYTEVGIYSSAMTLVHVFAIIQRTFNTLWGPMQIEHYTMYPEDKSFFQKGNQMITVIMFFIGVHLILLKDVFAFILGAEYRKAAYIFPFLIFNPIMYTISETTCAGISISKKSYLNIFVSLGACVTNILGNILLVPSLGSSGAAISTGVSYIVFFALRTIFSNKYYYVNYNMKKFIIITITTILYACYNTFFQFGIFSIVGYIICISIFFLLYYNTIKQGIFILKRQFRKMKNKN